jgi:hypothetical protein
MNQISGYDKNLYEEKTYLCQTTFLIEKLASERTSGN